MGNIVDEADDGGLPEKVILQLSTKGKTEPDIYRVTEENTIGWD